MTQYYRLLYNSKISVTIETGVGKVYNCIVIRIQLRMHVTLCTCILYNIACILQKCRIHR